MEKTAEDGMNTPYREGQKASEDGLKTCDNPYDIGTQGLEHIDWLLGLIDKSLEMWDDHCEE